MKALVMCLADTTTNPRPNRVVQLLDNSGYLVDVLGYAFNKSTNLPVNKLYKLKKPSANLRVRLLRLLFRSVASVAARLRLKSWAIHAMDFQLGLLQIEDVMEEQVYDLMIVENLELLPFAFRIRNDAKLIFDAREFYTKEFESSWFFKFFDFPYRYMVCSVYLNRCDHLITVSPGLAAGYKKDFGVDMTVVRSVQYYREMPINKTSNGSIRMVHHGIANSDRGIKNMIDVVRSLDSRFTLDLYLVGSDNNIAELKRVAEDCDRIRFCDPVQLDKIISMLNNYDLGFYYLQPKGFNVTFNLPNKFFEFIQARLAIAIGPSPDMAQLVREYQCGFVAEEFTIDSMARTLLALRPEHIDQAKANSDLAANELCYEMESLKLLSLIN